MNDFISSSHGGKVAFERACATHRTLQKLWSKMRFLKIFSTLVVLSVLCFSAIAYNTESVYNDVLRMHIIANSDSEKDQSIKLCVRDLILSKYSPLLSGYSSREEAMEAAAKLIPDMEALANGYLSSVADYNCKITLSNEYFPTKTYGSYKLPCGMYTALCIRLGTAEGKNFWCVMFPPLCLGTAEAENDKELFLNCGLSESEYELMRGQKPLYRVKFKFLELLANVFGK